VDPLYLKHDQQGQAPDYRVQYNIMKSQLNEPFVRTSIIYSYYLKLLYSTGRSRWEDDFDR